MFPQIVSSKGIEPYHMEHTEYIICLGENIFWLTIFQKLETLTLKPYIVAGQLKVTFMIVIIVVAMI